MRGESLSNPRSLLTTSTRSSLQAPIDSSPKFSQKHLPPADPGTLKWRESGPSYIQSEHWEAVLSKIRGLKEDPSSANRKPPLGSHLFYGRNRDASRHEILAAVPARSVVDRLIALHFDSYIITPYLIHSKKFLREYGAFWKDPSACSVAWIGLMFAMLYVATQLQLLTTDFINNRVGLLKAECLSMRDAFREKAVQCLVLARYTVGGPHILEALITFFTGEFVLSKDSGTDGSLFIGMILHLALRMGYHRDPDNFPGISPFEGEMRRQVWATIVQVDLIVSLEMGLPRNARDTQMDTKPPCNLRDCDFDEDIIELPVPLPESEWTPVLALIARGRLVSALGLICDVNTNVQPPSHGDIQKIDALLVGVHTRSIPSVLRSESTTYPITDSPDLVIQRVSVETTYHKSRILLYRRSLIKELDRKRSEEDRESVRICLDSALKILSFQQMLHEEAQPFGRLCQLRWRVARIFNLDVLLATSVLCLYLQDVHIFGLASDAGSQEEERSLKAGQVRQQLTVSRKIWLEMSSTSAEAEKVAKALSIVLGHSQAAAGRNGRGSTDDILTDLDATLMSELDVTSNHPYFPSGFYSPLTFFDNVL